MKDSWIEYFLRIAEVAASKSKDPVAKVGCVIVGNSMEIKSTGYNGFPRKTSDAPELYENRETKLTRIVHAEINAIAAAARNGTPLYASTAVITKPCCSQCAAALIQAGVGEIIMPGVDYESRWYENQQVALEMLKEARVRVTMLEE